VYWFLFGNVYNLKGIIHGQRGTAS
jgi:hypothetical protein